MADETRQPAGAMQVSNITDETMKRIENLLDHGAGVSLAQIAQAVGCEPDEQLEGYLLRMVAAGKVKRHWSNAHSCHFYERLKR